MRSVSIIGAIALLTACGPMNKGGLGNQLASAIQARTSGDAAPAPTAPALPSVIAGNVLLTTLTGKDATAPLTRAQTRGRTTTWISPGDVTLALEDGILVGTRGLGNDLMGADIAGVRAAITRGSGSNTRVHSYLDSQDNITSITLTCTVTRVGPEQVTLAAGPRTLTRTDELCKSAQLVFTNSYWTAGENIVKSKQAISPSEGFMIAEAL